MSEAHASTNPDVLLCPFHWWVLRLYYCTLECQFAGLFNLQVLTAFYFVIQRDHDTGLLVGVLHIPGFSYVKSPTTEKCQKVVVCMEGPRISFVVSIFTAQGRFGTYGSENSPPAN